MLLFNILDPVVQSLLKLIPDYGNLKTFLTRKIQASVNRLLNKWALFVDLGEEFSHIVSLMVTIKLYRDLYRFTYKSDKRLSLLLLKKKKHANMQAG